MNRTTWPSESLISLRTAFRRSSNSPRNFAPAISAPRSSETTRLSLSALGHVAADDPLGEALDDRGLADARLADQDRVVLRPPAQDLDDPADLLVAADDRVELAGPGLGGQVAAVLLERGVGALRVRRGDALAAADALERVEDRLARRRRGARAAGGPRRRPRRRRAAGARSRRTRRRAGGPPARPSSRTRFARGSSAELSRPGSGPACRGSPASSPRNVGQVDAEPAERLGGDAVVGLDERVEQVLGVEDGADSHASSAARWAASDRLLGLLGVAVELHRRFSGIVAGSGSGRGSRWSAQRGVGLVDDVEERAGGLRRPRRRGSAGGRRGPWREVADRRPCGGRHALALEPERSGRSGSRPGCAAGPCPSASSPAPPRRAAPRARVIGSSRSRSAPVRLKTGWGRTRTATTRSPPSGPWPVSLISRPVVGAARDRHLEALARRSRPAGSCRGTPPRGRSRRRLGGRRGRRPWRAARPAAVRRGAARRADRGAVRGPSRRGCRRTTGRRSAARPAAAVRVGSVAGSPSEKNIRKKSEKSPPPPPPRVRNS